MTLRITEAELARDVGAVLRQVEQGTEIIVERDDDQTVAVISAPRRSGRPIREILREARERRSIDTLDEDFGTDLNHVIEMNSNPWTPPSWD